MKLFKTALFTTLLGASTLAATPVMADSYNQMSPNTQAQASQADNGVHKGAKSHKKIPPLVKLTKKLDLTDEQKNQIANIINAATPQLEQLGQKFAATSQQIHDAMRSENYDFDQVKSLAKVQGDNLTQLIEYRANLQHEVLAVLTPEQKEKLKGFIANMAEKARKQRPQP